MGAKSISSPAVLLLTLLLSCHVSTSSKAGTYIIHMAKSRMPPSFTHHSHWYDASLRSVSDSAEILYNYDTVAHGFSARLTEAEAEALESLDGVISVVREKIYELHTTRSPEFLGLDRSMALNPQSLTSADVIIGVLDTGVWPGRRSFNDAGFGPMPASWKEACEQGKGFKASTCNRKLIGARFFAKGVDLC